MAGGETPLSRETLPGFLATFEGDNHLDGWAELWKRGDCLPWDRGIPNPALEDVLTQQRSQIGGPTFTDAAGRTHRRMALVPGCGRGVDVLLLASFGYDAYGLEYSPGAVEACKREEQLSGDKYPVRDANIGRGKITWIQGDFFKDNWLNALDIPHNSFDLIYDYTFFCALDRTLRPKWAARHRELLSAPPVGTLICLEFPRHKPPTMPGPPYAAPSEAYMEHLSHPGDTIPYDANGCIQVGHLRSQDANGFDRVAYFTPGRTHEVGIDQNGEIQDRVSLWRLRG